jgi:hypothetical protein
MSSIDSEPLVPVVMTDDPAPPEPRSLRHGPWDIAAVASAVCGLMLIVPYIAGIAAIALALLGLRQISQRATRGRRLAYAGIVLGLLNIVGWTVYFKAVSELSSTGRFVAQHFIADLSAARPEAAQSLCQPAITPDRLKAASGQVMDWGGAKRVTVLYITSDSTTGGTTGSIRGDIQTPSGQHYFQMQTINDLVSDFTLQ